MARQEIILGTPPTGLGGDPPRTASTKINDMTTEIYTRLGQLKSASNRNVGVSEGDVMIISPSDIVNGNSSFNLDGSRFISYLDGSTTGQPPNAPNAVGIRSRFGDGSFSAIDIVSVVYQTSIGLYWRQVNAQGISLGWRRIYDDSNTTRASDGTLKAN